MDTTESALIQAIDRHISGMTESEKEMVLRFIYALEDLREPKPRTPQEKIHVADRQWLDAMGLIGHNVADTIKSQYEKGGYKVFAVEPIKPKRVVELDLCQLWAVEEPTTAADSEVCPE